MPEIRPCPECGQQKANLQPQQSQDGCWRYRCPVCGEVFDDEDLEARGE